MELVTQAALADYLAADQVLRTMTECSKASDGDLTCHKWLHATPAKRMIFERLYGDLIAPGPRQRVLDVGGGLTGLTRRLAAGHDYELVDILAHDDAAAADAIEAEVGRRFVTRADWYALESKEPYDVVIANDLFPNVDQRLALFVEKMLPHCREIRLSLTYYNSPRFYVTRRVDADEVFCMLAWDGDATARALAPFQDRIVQPDLGLFHCANRSVFANGRDVILVRLRGDGGTARRSNGSHQ